MKTLNCESFEAALASIAEIYEIGQNVVVAHLKNIKFDEKILHMPWDDYIAMEFEKTVGRQGKGDRTIWFHLTRCKVGTTFEQGVLPLNLVLPQIRKSLADMEEKAVREGRVLIPPMKGDPHFGMLYDHKTSNPSLWGPYAMLVRETAFCAEEMGNHDYLKIPEIVEDICYMETRRVDLIKIYSEITKPCIVKFFENELKSNSIVKALCYLHAKIHKEGLHMICNTCFNSKGLTIPHAQILAVDYFE